MDDDGAARHWAARFSSPSMGDRGQATHDFVLLGGDAVAIALAILDGRGLRGNGAPHQAVRAAIIALGRLGERAAAAVPALIACLSGDDDVLASEAALALGHIGPAAREAVPALADALVRGGAGPDLDMEAAAALGRVGGEEARRALAAFADDPTRNKLVRQTCARALEGMRTAGT